MYLVSCLTIVVPQKTIPFTLKSYYLIAFVSLFVCLIVYAVFACNILKVAKFLYATFIVSNLGRKSWEDCKEIK